MTKVRDRMIELLWFGRDPYGGSQPVQGGADLQGWNSQHPYLTSSIELVSPGIIVEVGVWKGGSTVFMANLLREAKLDAVVVAVDTWLGSSGLWTRREAGAELNFRHNTPELYETFIANIGSQALQQYVVPLRLDSLNAAEVLSTLKIFPDIIHIDAGHDYLSVSVDLQAWWPLLRPGGMLVGDDYYTDGAWPGVRRAVDAFFRDMDCGFEHVSGKFRVLKPA